MKLYRGTGTMSLRMLNLITAIQAGSYFLVAEHNLFIKENHYYENR